MNIEAITNRIREICDYTGKSFLHVVGALTNAGILTKEQADEIAANDRERG